MRVQGIDRSSIRERLARVIARHRQRLVRGEQPPQDFGVAVTAVAQHPQQPRQALDHVAGIGEEDLRHHHDAVAAQRDQVPVAQVLVHPRHRNAKHFGDSGQVVARLVGF